MEKRKTLRIGKSVVHGRAGPLRGEMDNSENYERTNKRNEENFSEYNNNNKENYTNSRFNNKQINENRNYENKYEDPKNTTEDILNSHYNKDDSENTSIDIFEQLLQRELAKGALGGGVVENNPNKMKGHMGKIQDNNANDIKYNVNNNKNNNFDKYSGNDQTNGNKNMTNTNNNNEEEDGDDMSKIKLNDRINNSVVRYRIHGYNEIIRIFSNNDDMNKKIEIINEIFRDEDCVLKYISDNNVICQLKASEMTEEYLNVLKEIYFYNYKDKYKTEDALIDSFVNEYRNKLFNLFSKIYIVLCEKILTNVKSFDNGFNIISKIIEYCSSDKTTLNILTILSDHMNSIYMKANKSVASIKGIKIKVVASMLLLFYKLLNSFKANVICVKTINKCCLKFNEMVDKSVKTNFYLLYIEILTQVKNKEFQNCILNELNSQQKNYITKELQKDQNGEHPKIDENFKTYLTNQTHLDEIANNLANNAFMISPANLIDETDVFKEVCTKQWEKRVLEGCVDNNNTNSNNNANNNNTSLSNENLLPWKIKVEAINLLYEKIKSKFAIKKTAYISTILGIISKLLKNESALPVVVSTLKLLHILIEKFEKDIYTTIKKFSFVLCSKLKDSNKQVSNACMECLTKAIIVYNIDIFIDDLSKNFKDKNNNTRLLTLEFIIKVFDHIDKKNIITIIDITKHLLNDTVANIKNAAFKVYAMIIANYTEEIYPSFFNSISPSKKKSILALCSSVQVAKKQNKADKQEDKESQNSKRQKEYEKNDAFKNSKVNNEEYSDNTLSIPNNIMNNLNSTNFVHKIEALNSISEWLKEDENINNNNFDFEKLVNIIKTNCYEFKGKYSQLNLAIYDFFNKFIDILFNCNFSNNNNNSFIKIMNTLICLYLEKVADQKEGIICSNFINKCFQYFDNNIIIDILIKNNSVKFAKRSEKCIKILQKIFLNKGPSSNINVKPLVYFLKPFVDSKNTNLKNSSILLLQILSKNFGDKNVLSYLEGISENIRQIIKLKEDLDKFFQKQGTINLQTSSASILTKSNYDNKNTSSAAISSGTDNKIGDKHLRKTNIMNENKSADGISEVSKWEQANGKQANSIMHFENHDENMDDDNTTTYSRKTINTNILTNREQINKYQNNENEEYKNSDGNRLKNNTMVEINYTNSYLNYSNSIVQNNKNKESEIDERITMGNKKEAMDAESIRDRFGDDDDERMVKIGDIIKDCVNKISAENINSTGNNYSNSEHTNIGHSNIPANIANKITNNVVKIINIIEKIGKYYIDPDKLDMLINDNILKKIYSCNKNKCVQLLYVLLFSLRENTYIYSDVIFEFIIKMIEDTDIPLDQIDKLLICMCKNIGISKYISLINNYILSEKLNNIKSSNKLLSQNSGGSGNNNSYISQQNGHNIKHTNSNNNIGNNNKNFKQFSKRNEILIVINIINTNHILLLNENVIQKKVLKFYLDLFFEDNEQIREKSSNVLDNIYSKYGANIFFNIYEKLSAHKKECLHDILNQMKLNSDFSFFKIFSSNNSQVKRLSNNESNISTISSSNFLKSKNIKRLNSFTKTKTLKIEFPPNYKIKPDKLKWEKNLDQSHLNYLMKEFKLFSSQELVLCMFSNNPTMINRCISFFKEYLSNSSNQSTFFSKCRFLDLLLKWIFYSLSVNQNNKELLVEFINLIKMILKTFEDNYVLLNNQELVILVHFIFDKLNNTVVTPEISNKFKEILLSLCYISDHKLYFSYLLKHASSCSPKKICDALDILLKLIVLYKDKCLNIEKDVMKILQIFTVHSKNKNVTFYCLKIFANIQKFCPNLYKGIDNDDIAYYLKSKVDEFIEKWPNYNESSNDIQENKNISSCPSDNSEGIVKDEEYEKLLNYIRANAEKRNAIKNEVEENVNEFQNSVEEILKVKNKIENTEIHKINEDYINSQIACTSISKNLNLTMNGNNYSKTKELFHILESKNNEKADGSNTYENSMIYFRFVYLASFLYSDNVETISKVCKIIVENIIQLGKKSKNGNFILRESGNYVFKNFNLFIILIKGANFALRYLFQKKFDMDLNSSFIHFNAILSTVLLVDILMKKKSCIAKLSYDHFSFFFINTIVCLSIYTKIIHTNNYIYLFKNGEIARSLVTSILNNLLGREFLTNHSKLLEYVCNVSFNLGFDIMKNNAILIDDICDPSEFYIYINTYVKILNKIYKKIMAKISEENKKENNFVYRILNIIFTNLNKYDIFLSNIENEKTRKRKIDNIHEDEMINKMKNADQIINNIHSNKKMCNDKLATERLNNEKNDEENKFQLGYNSDASVYDCRTTYYENLNIDYMNNSTNLIIKTGSVKSASIQNSVPKNVNNINGYSNSRNKNSLDDGIYSESVKRKRDSYTNAEMDTIHKNRADFMDKYLFFIQLIFYGIKKNNPLILMAYIKHELINSYNENIKYYFKKLEILLNKDLKHSVPNVNINITSDNYLLDFSFEEFINQNSHFKDTEKSIFESYQNVLNQYSNFESEIIYNSFDLSIDDVIQKKKEFLESLKTININEITFNNNKFENLKETIYEYINDLESTHMMDEIQNAEMSFSYDFLCTMYRIPIDSDKSKSVYQSSKQLENTKQNEPFQTDKRKEIHSSDPLDNGHENYQPSEKNMNNNNQNEDSNKNDFAYEKETQNEYKSDTENNNKLTRISHNIYLRNETVENIDMNELQKKYNQDHSFYENNEQAQHGEHINQYNYKADQDKENDLLYQNQKSIYNKQTDLNAFSYEENDKDNVNQLEDKYNTSKNKNKNKGYLRNATPDPEHSKDQLEINSITSTPFNELVKCSNNDIEDDEYAEAMKYTPGNYSHICVSNCSKNYVEETEKEQERNDEQAEQTNDIDMPRRKCNASNFSEVINEDENSVDFQQNKESDIYEKSNDNIENSIRGCSNSSYKNEKEINNPHCVLRRAKLNDKGFNIFDRNKQMNSKSATAPKTFLKSKTSVKNLINKYEAQRERPISSNLKTNTIFSQKKTENYHHNSGINNREANKIPTNRTHKFGYTNKLISNGDNNSSNKEKKYSYERSLTSVSDIKNRRDRKDMYNLTSHISNDVGLKSFPTSSSVSSNFNDRKNYTHPSSDTRLNNIFDNKLHDDHHRENISSSTKRKNQIGIPIPMKKSIL
ncbi:conserved Plasmodium protein, unknown function [Plasmodium vinckei]|uniref:TOG domain-containing protein n=1 Tax=Plasmodium vinckei TaxID=5860 RepID=A0A6V7SKY5_PLAVN|nr:conserved Plasmodium protein, unknown function [Plasmodium vinckei]